MYFSIFFNYLNVDSLFLKKLRTDFLPDFTAEWSTAEPSRCESRVSLSEDTKAPAMKTGLKTWCWKENRVRPM